MAIAVVVTFALTGSVGLSVVALVIGGAIGAYAARRVEMTQMPELVAAMHSLVGLAAVLIAFAVVSDPQAFGLAAPLPAGNRVELFLGTLVGMMIVASAGLSFLGLGVQPPTPDWGAILEQGKNFILVAWWISLWPGLFLLASAFAVMVFGRLLQQRLGAG